MLINRLLKVTKKSLSLGKCAFSSFPAFRKNIPDEIIINALPVSARIGVTEEERETPQPLVLHVNILQDLRACSQTDKITDTISYASLQKSMVSHCYETFNNGGIKTIESLANQLARIAIVEHGSERVRIRIDKPGAIRTALGASVIIERDRLDFVEALTSTSGLAPNAPFYILGLGSNMGDRAKNISSALEHIRVRLKQRLDMPVSFLYETVPVLKLDQPDFLNCACKVFTDISPHELLDICKSIEKELGRDLSASAERYGPRPIDIDILISNLDTGRVADERLTIPHAALRDRAFALAPLCDLDPSLVTPSGDTAYQLYSKLTARSPAGSLGIKRVVPVKTRSGSLHVDDGVLMGILNVTPDSFADTSGVWGDGSRTGYTLRATRLAADMLRDGASIIDVGGCSTRPGAGLVPPEEELERVIPVIERLRQNCDENLVISVDTFRQSVAVEAIRAGASIINDVSGGTAWGIDRESTLSVAAKYNVPIVLMHNRGTPAQMNLNNKYGDDVPAEIVEFLSRRLEAALSAGIPRYNIITDTGIGFGKTGETNLEILKNLERITAARELLGVPSMISISRKKFIGKMVAESRQDMEGIVPAEERKIASAVAAAFAVSKGVKIVRTHDVKETADALAVARSLSQFS